MNQKQFLIVVLLVVLAGFTACQRDARRLDEADVLLQQGLEQRAAKNTEAAAESFSLALVALNQCNADAPDVQRLKARVEDQLGAMYWKHGLAEEALALHVDAASLSRQLDDPELLMTALRNCGRVTASLQRTDEARAYYEESMQIAEKQSDRAFCNELLMETSHDLYLENGDYTQAIENASQALAGGAEQGFCNLVIGLSYYYLDENDTALVFLHEASQSEKPSVRMSAYQAMYLIYQDAGDYQQALQCHELFNENMSLADRQFRSEEVQRIKGEYDLQMQKNTLQAEQKLKSLYLYLILIALLVVLAIDKVYDNFTQRLLEQYPNLTKSDLQICCLTKQGFSNQVISILMNIQTGSYARRKSRLKQEKMDGLNDDRSFEEIINDI